MCNIENAPLFVRRIMKSALEFSRDAYDEEDLRGLGITYETIPEDFQGGFIDDRIYEYAWALWGEAIDLIPLNEDEENL